MKFYCLLAVLLCVVSVRAQTALNLPQLGKSPVKDVIAAMTLEEKTKLVTGMAGMAEEADKDSTVWKRVYHGVQGAAGITYPIPRLGIPLMTFSDGPAGVRIDPIKNDDITKRYYGTAFPVGTLLASSWDTSLVKKVAASFGNEVHEYGIDVILAPGMNIQRNPLGGRNFEYYSEDPLLSGTVAAAFVNGIQSNGVGATIKHFVANNQETNRLEVSSDVSERALREIYLKGFEIAVKTSDPWSVMSSYNRLNGIYTSESKDLLTNVLRNEWHYKGMVMSDWGSGKDPVTQQRAGNNILMPGWDTESDTIEAGIKKRMLNEKMLDENVERILMLALKSPSFNHYQYSNEPDLKKHAQVAREGADESMVLLKNDIKTLPFLTVKKIALFGSTSYYNIPGGTGSGAVNKSHNISLASGLKDAGYMIDPLLEQKYNDDYDTALAKAGKDYNPVWNALFIPELNISKTDLEKEATSADIAVITIGRNSGEGADRTLSDFNLTPQEQDLISNTSSVFHKRNKKLVVVLNIPGPIEMNSWRDEADAILLAWQPGQEGGFSVADILSGKVNPSGKLAVTFPLKYDNVPSAKHFPGALLADKDSAHAIYKEGIYVGYRYYNTFKIKTAYEFGFGLSYTTFKYTNLSLSSSLFNKKIIATVTITNTGKKPGKEVVQLYLSAPSLKLNKPKMELKAFAKTKLLKPNESQNISFTLLPEMLASFNTLSSAWIAEAGNYVVNIGASSSDMRSSANFNLPKEIMVEKVTECNLFKVHIDFDERR